VSEYYILDKEKQKYRVVGLGLKGRAVAYALVHTDAHRESDTLHHKLAGLLVLILEDLGAPLLIEWTVREVKLVSVIRCLQRLRTTSSGRSEVRR
jgi:hypothetical protein